MWPPKSAHDSRRDEHLNIHRNVRSFVLHYVVLLVILALAPCNPAMEDTILASSIAVFQGANACVVSSPDFKRKAGALHIA